MVSAASSALFASDTAVAAAQGTRATTEAYASRSQGIDGVSF